MSASASASASRHKSTNLSLVESLMEHIDDFQNGTANEHTYLSAMNALRDLHKYVAKTEKERRTSKSSKKSAVVILIDGEEFFMEDYENIRLAVRVTDNYAYCADTGDFVGIWNEQTRTLIDVDA
jgi:hypothetical protein